LTRQHHIFVRRFAVIGGCVASTLATIAWIAMRPGPAEWQARLEQVTLANVHVGRVATPRPGVTRLNDIRLTERSQPGSLLIDAMTVDTRGLVREVTVADLQLDLAAVWPTLIQLATALPDKAVADATHIFIGAVDLRSQQPGLPALALRDVEIRVQPRGDHWLTVVEFRAGDQGGQPLSASAPPRVTIAVRCAMNEQRQVDIEVNTGAVQVPAALVATLLPALTCWGPNAQISGALAASRRENQWHWRAVDVHLDQVDLETLVERPFGHVLRGTASIDVHHCHGVGGRIIGLDATVASPAGQIGRSLLDAAERCLAMRKLGATQDPVTDYHSAQLRVEMRGGLMRFGGNAEGCVAQTIREPLLVARDDYLVPVDCLIEAMMMEAGGTPIMTPAVAQLAACLLRASSGDSIELRFAEREATGPGPPVGAPYFR